MALQILEGVEAVAGNGVAFHVADAALVLTFGSGAVRRARSRGDFPVAAERVETVIEAHVPGLCVVFLDEGAVVV